MSSKAPTLPPNEQCPECKGKGRVLRGWRFFTCTRCDGMGKCELKQRPISPPPPPKKMPPRPKYTYLPVTKAKPRKHPDPTVEVPIELIRSLAVKAWMRNDIATADLLYGLLGETTATAHERSDDAP